MIIRDAEIKDAPQLDLLLERLIRYESQYDSNLNPDCEIRDNYCSRIGLEGHKLILIEEAGEMIGYLYGFVYHITALKRTEIAGSVSWGMGTCFPPCNRQECML